MTPEGKVKKECRAYLRSIGAYVFSPVQMGYGQQGLDDFVCIHGLFVAIEYKRGDKPAKPTARQEHCIAEVQKANGHAWVVTSLAELQKCLGSLARYYMPQCELKERLRYL